ncbi:trehalose-6-phosphate synthase [Escherichia coli]|uniref:alpha,alpha-trehalose-phosphate synthase (UDP-forming) n=1 Tax=Escherichia coli TaxID=562 RepID=UPI001A8D45C9|nr:trehalose-6-phosphate synthase [Escherichia coli]MCE1999543.1 trehalose-6-phosphate synthase [Escherichia coli]
MTRLMLVTSHCDTNKQQTPFDKAVNENIEAYGGIRFGWNGSLSKGKCQRQTYSLRIDAAEYHTWDISPGEYENYYRGYVHQTLWPIFHNRPDLAVYRREYFTAYKSYNAEVVELLSKEICGDDLIWVHDYHHLAVGRMLKEAGYLNQCGLLLHQPFPAGDIFRTLSEHEWLLQSILHYDLLGFQSAYDANSFISYITRHYRAERLSENMMKVNGHIISIGVFPCGIATHSQNIKKKATLKPDDIIQKYNRRIIISNDVINDISGTYYRMDAMRSLLNAYPQFIRDVSLLQISQPAHENSHASPDLQNKLEGLCGRINGQYGDFTWYPINYLNNSLCSHEIIHALYARAEVAIFTSLCEGMSLEAKEFILAQPTDNPGVLIISLFSGAAEQLSDAIIINPYDVTETASAIHSALMMPLHERKRRHQNLLQKVHRQNNHWWRQSFQSALEENEAPLGPPEEIPNSMNYGVLLSKKIY